MSQGTRFNAFSVCHTDILGNESNRMSFGYIYRINCNYGYDVTQLCFSEAFGELRQPVLSAPVRGFKSDLNHFFWSCDLNESAVIGSYAQSAHEWTLVTSVSGEGAARRFQQWRTVQKQRFSSPAPKTQH